MRSTRHMARACVAVIIASTLAGCIDQVGEAPADARPSDPPVLIPAVEQDHDHHDAKLHPQRSEGVTVVHAIRYEDGPFPGAGVSDAGSAGRVQVAGELMFIASLRGGAGGFAVVDVANPARPLLVSNYASDNGMSEGEALAVTDDAAFAFISYEAPYNGPDDQKAPHIEIVDLADPATPAFAGLVETAEHQPHVLTYFRTDDGEYLVASQYAMSLYAQATAAGALPGALPLSADDSSNHVSVGIYAFDRAGPSLTEVARHRFDADTRTDGVFFPHDPVVIDHPVTGERVLYLAAFAGGGRIISLEDPAAPYTISYTLDHGEAPVLRHHSYIPGPRLVDGTLPTAAIPRSSPGDGFGSAYLSLYDTAEPRSPRLMAQWRHPDASFVPGDEPPLNLHIPAFAFGGSVLLVPHFHAGLYMFRVGSLDAIEALEPFAWFLPGAPPDDGAPAMGVIAAAVEVGGTILAVDAASGTLYAMQLT